MLGSSTETPMTTRISVITAVRNGANFIAEAIKSALPQLESCDEWLVINDHSTDETCAIVKSFGDPRIQLLDAQRSGMSAARNDGLQKAQGEYIAFLDHDDLWPPDRLAAMRARLDAIPTIDAVVGRLRVRFEPGAVAIEDFKKFDGQYVKDANVGPFLFRHSIIRRGGDFAEDMAHGEDVDFVRRLKECGMQIELMDIDSLVYRRHATNATNDRGALRGGVFDALRRKLARARTPPEST
jgi:glycosyltransferase involved in cell wall biosynthesis